MGRLWDLLQHGFRDNSDTPAEPGRVRDLLTDRQMPRLPENVLPLLKECIEFCDDKPAVKIAALVRRFQLQHSKIELIYFLGKDTAQFIQRQTVEDAILEAAELHSRSVALLPFARNETSEVPNVGRQEIYKALRHLMPVDQAETLADKWHERSNLQQARDEA
jgi:hypothetical protein